MPQFDEILSDFSKSDEFDVVKWTNNALALKDDSEALEPFLASLSMRLHLTSQDYTDKLESGMLDAISTTPRLSSEINRIENLLKSFSDEMNDLSSQLRTFDQRNIVGVEDLSRLDTLKSNMQLSKSTLEEHVKWGRLVKEAKTFMEGGGRLSESADRLDIMYQSLSLLDKVPGHDERSLTCKELSEGLLSAVRPRVRRSLMSNDLSHLSEFLYIYDKLQRRKELED